MSNIDTSADRGLGLVNCSNLPSRYVCGYNKNVNNNNNDIIVMIKIDAKKVRHTLHLPKQDFLVQ